MSDKIEYRVYRETRSDTSRIKNIYSNLASLHLSFEEIWREIKRSKKSEIVFINKKTGTDCTPDMLLRIIKRNEVAITSFGFNEGILKRIIKGGGFLNYIKTLEPEGERV